MRILFTGGGTGGHLFPIIAIAREIRRLYGQTDLSLFYVGPKDEFVDILLSQENIVIKNISSGKIRRYFSWKNFSDILFKIPFSILQSFYFLILIRPQIVFCKGGTGSLPVVIAAKIFRIPIFLHESDIVPGLSNQKASKWATKIFISFPKTEYFDLAKCTAVGNPTKKELTEGNKEIAKDLFRLTFEKPIVLFMGGSQGAEAINDFILRVINTILKKYEVIHICGMANLKEVQAEAQVVINKDLEKYYHPYGFLYEEKMKHAYKSADIIVSRAGSGSIFEIAAVGKPSILVPLPGSAQNHQFKNAYEYARGGAALIIEQENLEPNFFMENLDYLFEKPEDLKKMIDAALGFSKPFAAKAIAREILEYLGAKENIKPVE